MTEPVLHARGLGRRFGAGADGFVLRIDEVWAGPGASVAVTGPSGCGKSTLLGLLSLALRPEGDGLMQVCSTDALALWRSGRDAALTALRAASLGFVPQTAALLPFLSLRDNIALPQATAGRRDPGWMGELAGQLGLVEVWHRRPAQVSVGQRQRTAIARALAARPALVLADEPTASVHPGQADAILRLLRGLAREAGTALVITTHDPGRAEAAGFTLAPCRMEGTGETTVGWHA